MSPPTDDRHDALDPVHELREVSDARTLRALTHPIRVALIEMLSIYGPTTATEAGERLGESPASCSFHLRQLEKYGFVEEAGGGRGRARPWKMTRIGMTFSNVHEDAEAQLAAAALSRLLRGRQLERYEAWLQGQASYPEQWRGAGIDLETVFWMTPEELNGLGQRFLDELVMLYRDRLTDPSRRPAGALPVELLVLGYPMEPPSAAD
jgi:DNA-binding transcriptional ArsR family regulator